MSTRRLFRIVLLFAVCVILSSCSGDYSNTGRYFLYAAGLVAGFAVDRGVAALKEEKESALGIFLGFATIGIFALAATYIPEELATSIGIIACIVGVIAVVGIMLKK